MVSVLSSSVSAFITYLLFNKFRKEQSKQSMSISVMNSSLAGLVAITGVCDDVNVYSALAIGFFAGLIYLTSTQIMERYRIDDPVEAIQIHGICGFFGVLNVGIFGSQNGFITESQNSFKQFGIQFLGALAIILWGAVTSFIYFQTVKSIGRLRVNKFYEVVGIDVVMHTMSDQIGDDDHFDRDSRLQKSKKQ
jgi:Amt family ammonium transporter